MLQATYYNALRVQPKATDAEINRAYFSLSLQHHPDRADGQTGVVLGLGAEFRDVSEAYQVVSDPERRRLYDKRRMQKLKRGDNFRDPRDVFLKFFEDLVVQDRLFVDYAVPCVLASHANRLLADDDGVVRTTTEWQKTPFRRGDADISVSVEEEEALQSKTVKVSIKGVEQLSIAREVEQGPTTGDWSKLVLTVAEKSAVVLRIEKAGCNKS